MVQLTTDGVLGETPRVEQTKKKNTRKIRLAFKITVVRGRKMMVGRSLHLVRTERCAAGANMCNRHIKYLGRHYLVLYCLWLLGLKWFLPGYFVPFVLILS